MAAGDAQRVWFPEMLDDLRNFYSKDVVWEALADFCECMTEKRKRIRPEVWANGYQIYPGGS